MYATTFILDVRDNVSCRHHAGWDQSSKFHHGKWKFDEVIWRQEHILDGRCLCKQKGNWHCFAVLTWNSEPAEVLLQHVLSKLYQNNPGITRVTCSIPTNILTLQTTLTKSLGFKYSSSPAATYRHQTGWWWELELGGQPREELLPAGSPVSPSDLLPSVVSTDVSRALQGLHHHSFPAREEWSPFRGKRATQTAKPHLQEKNQYLLITFYSVRCRVVKLTKLSWFYRKGLGLERMTPTKTIEKRSFRSVPQ